MDEDSSSPGLAWIVGIILLFILGLGYIILNQVMVNYVNPMGDELIDNSPYIDEAEKTELKAGNNKYIDYWSTLPYIFVFLIVIFLIIAGIRHGGLQW